MLARETQWELDCLPLWVEAAGAAEVAPGKAGFDPWGPGGGGEEPELIFKESWKKVAFFRANFFPSGDGSEAKTFFQTSNFGPRFTSGSGFRSVVHRFRRLEPDFGIFRSEPEQMSWNWKSKKRCLDLSCPLNLRSNAKCQLTSNKKAGPFESYENIFVIYKMV